MQSQLRTQLLAQIQRVTGPDAVKSGAIEQSRGMWHSAANSLVMEYLSAIQCPYSLSVLQSELDLPNGAPFNTQDVEQLLQLSKQPHLQAALEQLMPKTGLQGLSRCQHPSTNASSSLLNPQMQHIRKLFAYLKANMRCKG
jgi:hypothetical protein